MKKTVSKPVASCIFLDEKGLFFVPNKKTKKEMLNGRCNIFG
jgi:hypothetical protein